MAIQIIPNFRKPHKGILQEPDKHLRTVCKSIVGIDHSIKEASEKLVKILREVDKPFKLWLGMAAPQIGFDIRMFAIKRSYRNYSVLINPEILEQKWLFPTITGCYSLKALYLGKSHYWFEVKYQDLEGRYHQEIFKGGNAVLIQQEIDHLDGKLACD